MEKVSVITILIGVIGGFLSAFIPWSIHYSKWLLEKRIEAFSKFLTILETVKRKTFEIHADNSKSRVDKEVLIFHAFEELYLQSNICSLFIGSNNRDKFRAIYDKIYSAMMFADINAIRVGLSDVQSIFESELLITSIINQTFYPVQQWLFKLFSKLRKFCRMS